MKPASAKAKGRRLQQIVAGVICEQLDLPEEDVKSAIMGESGMDIHLSTLARERFPFATECKNQERLNIWKALDQAAEHAGSGLSPLVIFKRNRSPVYAALPFPALVALLRELAEVRG